MKLKSNILFCIFIAGVALAKISSSDLLTIFDQPGWKKTKTLSDGMTVWRKPVPGADLKAIMATNSAVVNPRTIIEVIQDVNRYREFSTSSSYLIDSRIVSVDSNVITGYECLSVPFLQDRQYFFQLREIIQPDKPNETRIDWQLLPPSEKLLKFLNDHPSKAKNPIFLGEGAGSWICDNIGEGHAIVSYRLHLSFAGSVPTIAVDFGQKVGVIGFFRDVIKEAQRRDTERNPKPITPINRK